MRDLLVGSTGFVGGNLSDSHTFEAACHSSDVLHYYNSQPELCIYAGIPSAMFLANSAPEKDLAIMWQALENIRRIRAKQLVLISTIAVYADCKGCTEDDATIREGMRPYGYHRGLLENRVREEFDNALIVRLPALYGRGLKKNFLYDLRTITPSMLSPEKYRKLGEQHVAIAAGYDPAPNGYYVLNEKVPQEVLRGIFEDGPFNALCFTDSRSRFQFYPLSRLWRDIKTALKNGIQCLNLTPPPLSAAEVFRAVYPGKEWHNELHSAPFDYDMRSNYAELLGGCSDGYLCSAEEELCDICRFITER